jgi:hypothetical protein
MTAMDARKQEDDSFKSCFARNGKYPRSSHPIGSGGSGYLETRA